MLLVSMVMLVGLLLLHHLRVGALKPSYAGLTPLRFHVATENTKSNIESRFETFRWMASMVF